MSRLTDPKVFEARYVCSECGKPPAELPDEPRDDECDCNPKDPPRIVREKIQRFLPGASRVAPIIGTRNGHDAHVNIPQPIVYHSPTGFEWGYGGSGPADLALNILALFVPLPEAWRLHQRFKFEVVGGLPHDGWALSGATVRAWITDYWQRELVEPEAGEG